MYTTQLYFGKGVLIVIVAKSFLTSFSPGFCVHLPKRDIPQGLGDPAINE